MPPSFAFHWSMLILPKETDLQLTRNLLLAFGDVSGLQTNFQKKLLFLSFVKVNF